MSILKTQVIPIEYDQSTEKLAFYLKEYLEDYASDDTTKAGEDLIQKEVKKIPRDRTREIVGERLVKIAQGERDFRF